MKLGNETLVILEHWENYCTWCSKFNEIPSLNQFMEYLLNRKKEQENL